MHRLSSACLIAAAAVSLSALGHAQAPSAAGGMLVYFGNSSGAAPPFEPLILSQKGSLYLTRPTLASYTRNAEELRETSDDLFSVIASGKVKIAVNQRFKLADVRAAHEALHSRATTGATVLLP